MHPDNPVLCANHSQTIHKLLPMTAIINTNMQQENYDKTKADGDSHKEAQHKQNQ